MVSKKMYRIDETNNIATLCENSFVFDIQTLKEENTLYTAHEPT